MGANKRNGIRAASLICAALISVTMTTASAVADPEPGAAPGAPTVLGLRDLGFSPTLSFFGLTGQQQVTIPVPQGLMPAALDATVELPMGLRAGSIAVVQDEKTLSRVDVPPADISPIRLPLNGLEVRDNSVTLELRANLIPLDGYCFPDASNPLRMNDTAVEFAGAEQPPTTVADFLPPVLQRFTVYLPAKPIQAESDAAVRLTAAVVAHYGNQPTLVTTAALDGDQPLPPAQPFERQVIIREGGAPAVALQSASGVPPLLITGPAWELTNQTRLLSSGDLARMALSSKAVAGPLKDSPQLPADQITLRDMGQQGLTAIAAVNPQVNIGLDQTRLGRPAHNVRLHLIGSYTPLPSNLNGQVAVTVNGETISRWPVVGDGTIDRSVDVPDRVLQRYTNVAVAVNAAGNTGGCGRSQPLTLTIDGDSTVSSEAAATPVPAGFQSIPQALMPNVDIGIGDDAFVDTARAAKLVAGLQRLSALPFNTSVVPLQQALGSSNPAVLISARGWTDDKIKLPVDASNDDIQVTAEDTSGQQLSMTLDPRLRFGSLQAVRTGNRSVLVATSNDAAAQLDALLDWLNADPQRWQRLKGSAIISAPGRDPMMISAGATPTAKPPVAMGDSTSYWWIGAGVLAVVLLGAGATYLRTRNQPKT
jgi:hypothetical protein